MLSGKGVRGWAGPPFQVTDGVLDPGVLWVSADLLAFSGDEYDSWHGALAASDEVILDVALWDPLGGVGEAAEGHRICTSRNSQALRAEGSQEENRGSSQGDLHVSFRSGTEL